MKKIYEEAIAEAKQLKEVAENNAKLAILEAVTPRIKKLIESQLLSEPYVNEEDEDDSGDDESDFENLLLDNPSSSKDSVVESDVDGISLPDDEGKVTLDLDSIEVEDEDVGVDESMADLFENIEKLEKFSKVASRTPIKIIESTGKISTITKLISEIENMYSFVQSKIRNGMLKESCESRLEILYENFSKIKDDSMTRRGKNRRINEEDVTLTLTGLPDDLDLGSLGVDLMSGVEDDLDFDDEGSDDEDDLDFDDEGSDDDLDLDFDDEGSDDDLDLDFDDEGSDDDEIVEINESQLRKELRKMKSLRESRSRRKSRGIRETFATPTADGHGPGGRTLKAYGDADVEGDPLDLDLEDDTGESRLTVESRIARQRDLIKESVRRMDAARRAGNTSSVKFYKKRIVSLTRRGQNLLEMRNKSRGTSGSRRLHRLSEQKRRDSLRRGKGATNTPSRKAGSLAEERKTRALQNKLAEANLFNAKLAYANRLLQNESLNRAQKSKIMKKLDEARNLNEAKLVYETFASALKRSKSRKMNESANRGTSSRVTRSSSSTLNEGIETARWQTLAGIK